MRQPKLTLLLLAVVAVAVGIAACTTTTAPKPSPNAPIVINFNFVRPTSARALGMNEPALRRALDKYAVKNATRIRHNGKIWYPRRRIEDMRVGQVTKSDEAAPTGGFTSRPPRTEHIPNMADGADDGGAEHTQAARPPHTEYVSFASPDDFNCFMRFLQGRPCAD